MKALFKSLAVRAAVTPGRWIHRKKATLLNYHRYPAEHAGGFRRQCETLRRHYRVISMGELNRRLRDGAALPANAVAITVDDGHRDFYECAFPILREFGFAATMYLPTAFMDCAPGREWLWFDRFNYACRHAAASRLKFESLDLPLGPAAERADAAYRATVTAQWLPSGERDAYCDRMAESIGVRIPPTPPEEFAPLSWAQAREMAQCGIEFGGHTVTHPILATVGPAELTFETERCKARIEQELQAPALHFAYPSGRADEISAAAKDAVGRAGFETAVTTQLGQVGPGDDRLMLHRIGVDPWVPMAWFERCAAAMVG